MREPSYTRLQVDERRRQLLELGADLFPRHDYESLSMAAIAAEGGISKALLYHYFPSKQAFFEETLRAAAEEITALTEPAEGVPPLEALAASVDAYLAWVERKPAAYEKLIRSAGGNSDLQAIVEGVRAKSADRILGELAHDRRDDPRLRVAVRSWLWLMDGAILDWLEHRDLAREELRDYLLGALAGSLAAGGGADLLAPHAERPEGTTG